METNQEPIRFFKVFRGILCFFTSKFQGNMKRTREGGWNRRKFRLAYLFCPRLVLADTEQGNRVLVLVRNQTKRLSRYIRRKADAIVTNIHGLAIAVTGADCYSVFFLDPEAYLIGVAHAGAGSVSKGIIKGVIEAFEKLGSDPRNIHVEIGPGICQEHYEYDLDRARKEFPGMDRYIIPDKYKHDKCYVDLVGIIRYVLVKDGLQAKNIKISKSCTFTDENLFSQRRDNLDPVQAGMGVIMM